MQTPAQVAETANVSVQSVRNWIREYADLLSPKARGEDGPLLFDDNDVETICTIAALRKSGVLPADIAAIVRNQDVPPFVDVEPQQSHISPQTAPLALYAAHNTLQSRMDSLESRFEAQEANVRSRQHLAITMVVLGVLLGWVIVIVMQLLLSHWQG